MSEVFFTTLQLPTDPPATPPRPAAPLATPIVYYPITGNSPPLNAQ